MNEKDKKNLAEIRDNSYTDDKRRCSNCKFYRHAAGVCMVAGVLHRKEVASYGKCDLWRRDDK